MTERRIIFFAFYLCTYTHISTYDVVYTYSNECLLTCTGNLNPIRSSIVLLVDLTDRQVEENEREREREKKEGICYFACVYVCVWGERGKATCHVDWLISLDERE